MWCDFVYVVCPADVQGLRSKGKPVVVLGDLNCAHKEIDVYAPKKFTRAAGFTQVGTHAAKPAAMHINWAVADNGTLMSVLDGHSWQHVRHWQRTMLLVPLQRLHRAQRWHRRTDRQTALGLPKKFLLYLSLCRKSVTLLVLRSLVVLA